MTYFFFIDKVNNLHKVHNKMSIREIKSSGNAAVLIFSNGCALYFVHFQSKYNCIHLGANPMDAPGAL